VFYELQPRGRSKTNFVTLLLDSTKQRSNFIFSRNEVLTSWQTNAILSETKTRKPLFKQKITLYPLKTTFFHCQQLVSEEAQGTELLRLVKLCGQEHDAKRGCHVCDRSLRCYDRCQWQCHQRLRIEAAHC